MKIPWSSRKYRATMSRAMRKAWAEGKFSTSQTYFATELGKKRLIEMKRTPEARAKQSQALKKAWAEGRFKGNTA